MRRTLAVLAVAGLLTMAGCLGGGAVDEQALAEPANYEWNTSADVSVSVDGGSYQAVLAMNDRTNVSLFGPGEFGGETALPIRAVKYRYPNGTVVNASALSVSEVGERTVVEVPRSGGQLAYTAGVLSNELFLPVTINGSYAVRLPPGTAVSAPIIGGARPGGYDLERTEDRITLRWQNPETDVLSVDYYQERNLYIFGGLLGVAGLIAGAGLLYFRAQLRTLAARRGAVGPDDIDDP
ncbi:MAG: DUF5803 family protein [Halodesulfurarchaeum sp.]|nr:DUF5803 family protein [Halodesulfurarchaeum sp.]